MKFDNAIQEICSLCSDELDENKLLSKPALASICRIWFEDQFIVRSFVKEFIKKKKKAQTDKFETQLLSPEERKLGGDIALIIQQIALQESTDDDFVDSIQAAREVVEDEYTIIWQLLRMASGNKALMQLAKTGFMACAIRFSNSKMPINIRNL